MRAPYRRNHSYSTLSWVSIFLPIVFIIAVLIWFPSTIPPKPTTESNPVIEVSPAEPDLFKIQNTKQSTPSDNIRPTKISFYRTDRPNIVRVYFPNNQLTFGNDSCTTVYAVERTVSDSTHPEKAALLELLKGPFEAETKDGYITNLNSGITLLSILISDGVATANFDSALQKDVNGTCRVSGGRSQISKTLMQFPGIESVIITVNGKPI